ncbi:MAG: PAS domain-containing sensor histidine kinase [Gemmatimonadaceae bacterium]
MSTIRAQLTTAYAAALIGTVGVFAAVIWTTRREGAVDELRRHALVEANLALRLIRQSELAGEPVTATRDSLAGAQLDAPLRTMLEGMPDYLLVLDASGRILYVSAPIRDLNEDPDQLAVLMAAAVSAPTTGVAKTVQLDDRRLLMIAQSPADKNSAVSRVVVATAADVPDPAIKDLVETMAAVAPILLIASIALAYAIGGRAFQPVDRLVNEVQAITDGRSLHRRLPVTAGEEIAKLAITLNEMLERLESSFAALRRFTADASHELKTPLAVMRADVERAMSDRAPGPDKLIALEEALHETTRMADLVDSLLTLARADEGRFDLHRERVPLAPLAVEVFETATILGEAAGLTVSMPQIADVVVLADRTRLRQLFLNIVTNALKYTTTGSVELSLVAHDRTVAFTVRDTGMGISAADLPHIFERFYRADRVRSRSAERGGFGLGLAISQWIAEAHGGTISVRSRLGRGTTFTVTLPVAEEAQVVPQTEPVSAD